MVCTSRARSACRGVGPPNNQPITGNGQFNYSEEVITEICLPGLGHLGHTAAFDRSWPPLDSSLSQPHELWGCYHKRGPRQIVTTMWSLAITSQHPRGQLPGAPLVSEPTVMLKLYLCPPVFSKSSIDLYIVDSICILCKQLFVVTKEFCLTVVQIGFSSIY